MSETYPIKDKETLHSFRDYYKDAQPNPRNYSLIVTGLNTAFRISDLLKLRWQDVCRADGALRRHICIEKQKAGRLCTRPSLTIYFFNYTSSRTTSIAASPLRGPILMILV